MRHFDILAVARGPPRRRRVAPSDAAGPLTAYASGRPGQKAVPPKHSASGSAANLAADWHHAARRGCGGALKTRSTGARVTPTARKVVTWQLELSRVTAREVELLRGLLLEALDEMRDEEDQHRA
jgi:hypothetical protein